MLTGFAPSSPSSNRQRARPTPEAPTARIRISASSLHLFGSLGPPWVRVYWPAVLPEFDIEDGARTIMPLARCCRVPHHRDGLAGKDKLAEAYVYTVHPRKQNMIASACIDDQELPIRAELARIYHPAVGRRRNSRFGQRLQRNPLDCASGGVGIAEARDSPALGRQPQGAFRRLEWHRRLEAVGAGEGDFGRLGLDLDYALIGRRGEGLLLLPRAKRLLCRDLGIVLGDLDLGDLGIEAIDKLAQVGTGLCLVGNGLFDRRKLCLALGHGAALLFQEVIEPGLLGGEPIPLALLRVALLPDAILERHHSLKLVRQIVGLIFQLGEHVG